MSAIGNVVNRILDKRSGRLKELLVYDSKANILAPPSVADLDGDGRSEIVLATQEGRILALREDCSQLWTYSVAEKVGEVEAMFLDQTQSNGINHSPAIADLAGDRKSYVIFGTEFGKVYAINCKGKVAWSYKAQGAIRGGILVSDVNKDGRLEIIFGSSDKHLYILNRSGKLLKKFDVDSEIESTPSMFDELIVFGTNDGRICAYDSEKGPLWSYTTKGKIISEPSSADFLDGKHYVITGSTDNSIYCVDKYGNLVWRYETEGSIYSKAIIDDVNEDGFLEIIFGSCDNKIYVLNDEGNRIWSFETDFWIVGSPVVMDIDGDGRKEIVIGSYDSNVYVLSGMGTYSMSYVPGLSGIVTQDGDYSDIPTQSPGDILGRRLWLLKTPGIIIGCCRLGSRIIAQTKEGVLMLLEHTDI